MPLPATPACWLGVISLVWNLVAVVLRLPWLVVQRLRRRPPFHLLGR
jgi:hypothetical protein